jgi:hypothetical protein
MLISNARRCFVHTSGMPGPLLSVAAEQIALFPPGISRLEQGLNTTAGARTTIDYASLGAIGIAPPASRLLSADLARQHQGRDFGHNHSFVNGANRYGGRRL